MCIGLIWRRGRYVLLRDFLGYKSCNKRAERLIGLSPFFIRMVQKSDKVYIYIVL